MKYFLWYWLSINALAVLVCIVDKIKARQDLWRISQKALFAVSALGGSLGMLLCMKMIRQKTKHKRFMIGLPVMMVVQALVLLFCKSLWLTKYIM